MLVLVVGVVSVATGRANARNPRFLVLSAAAIALAAVNPVYYFFRVGRAVPLMGNSHGSVPNVDELTAVLRDPNIGLVTHAPFLVLALVFALAVLMIRTPRRLASGDAVSAFVGGVGLLFAFSQAINVNSGGTPGPSRYALWFVPLGLPLLRLLEGAPASPTGTATGDGLFGGLRGMEPLGFSSESARELQQPNSRCLLALGTPSVARSSPPRGVHRARAWG